ncbi:hypothetical protein M080_5244, partial [Bacteroides fragilis str. 3397 T10]
YVLLNFYFISNHLIVSVAKLRLSTYKQSSESYF